MSILQRTPLLWSKLSLSNVAVRPIQPVKFGKLTTNTEICTIVVDSVAPNSNRTNKESNFLELADERYKKQTWNRPALVKIRFFCNS